MMKRKITLLALLALPFASWAQPVITKSTFKTTFGDTLFTYNASYTIPTTFPKTGMQAWNFSSYGKDPLSSFVVFQNPALTPYAADFPTADYAMTFGVVGSGIFGYNYWKINNDSTWALGGRYPAYPSLNLDYTDPSCIYFPLKYGSTQMDYYSNTLTAFDSSKSKYVAYGSIKTPFGNYPNVILRENYDFLSGKWELSDYVWIDAATSLTVAMISSDGTPFWYTSSSKTTGMQEYAKEQYQLSVYPNPSTGALKLNYTLNTAANVGVDVVSISGQHVYSIPVAPQNAGRHQADVSLKHLSSGIYFAHIRIDDAVYVERVNLEK